MKERNKKGSFTHKVLQHFSGLGIGAKCGFCARMVHQVLRGFLPGSVLERK